jgi:hypothetical protein
MDRYPVVATAPSYADADRQTEPASALLPCVECGHGVEKAEYLMEPSRSYPYGGRTAEGKPLCGAHRITRCTGCDKLLPRHETSRVILRWHPRTHSFWIVRPHWEEVFTRYCAECAAGYTDARPPKYHVTPLQAAVLAAIAAAVALLIYVLAFNKLG